MLSDGDVVLHTAWSGVAHSANSCEYCVYYVGNVRLTKLEKMPTSATYLRQIIFVLDPVWVFAENYVKLQYSLTILSVVTYDITLIS